MAAISLLWKKSLRNQDISNLVGASQVTLSTRAIYAAILKKKHEPLTAENKTLRHGYSKSDLSKVYSLPFKITKEVKLQTLQYKILPSILPTQASLYQDGIRKNSDRCTLCKSKEQSFDHPFVSCNKATSFWNQFQTWWYEKTREQIVLNSIKILYGCYVRSTNGQALNYGIFVAKYYIFCARPGGWALFPDPHFAAA